MKERLKELRAALNLSQRAFAEDLGLSRGAIATYEVGRNEPTNAVIQVICHRFNVNEAWLRTGEGEMFAPAPSTAIELLEKQYGLKRRAAIAIEQFCMLSDGTQAALLEYFLQVAEAIMTEENNPELVIERKVAAYREKLYAEARSGRKITKTSNLHLTNVVLRVILTSNQPNKVV